MRAFTTDQLDDLYRSYKRDVPLDGYRHAMTITEYYNKVLRKCDTKGGKQHKKTKQPEAQRALPA